MKKSFKKALVESVCGFLESRASDPWEDDQWPAAYEVLTQVAKEIRDDPENILCELEYTAGLQREVQDSETRGEEK